MVAGQGNLEAATYSISRYMLTGQAQGASPMILQARKSTSLIVRGAGGQVYFARQLAAGEAYRVPAVAGVSALVVTAAGAAAGGRWTTGSRATASL